jgi:hypothetical protein
MDKDRSSYKSNCSSSLDQLGDALVGAHGSDTRLTPTKYRLLLLSLVNLLLLFDHFDNSCTLDLFKHSSTAIRAVATHCICND